MASDQPQTVGIDRQDRKCWLCGSNAQSYYDSTARKRLFFSCKTCGTYLVNPSFKSANASFDCEYRWSDDQKAMLSAYCRRNPGTWISIGPGDVERLCALVPQYTPPEKIDRLLQVLGEQTPSLGKRADFNMMTDYPLIVANGWQEVQYLVEQLTLEKFVSMTPAALPNEPWIILTMDGWNRIEEIKTSGRSLTQCFVAMAFRKDMEAVWRNVIEPAIKEAGYKPFRIDREHHVNRIDDEIIGQVRRSRFMVADFTLQRGGVYFEAGMMHGLGRKVVWMCHESELTPEKGLHFDIRQFNFLTYSEPDEVIKKQLYERILAIEGEGPLLTAEAEG